MNRRSTTAGGAGAQEAATPDRRNEEAPVAKGFMVSGPGKRLYPETFAVDSFASVQRFMAMEGNCDYVDKGWKRAVRDGFTVDPVCITIAKERN